MGNDGFMYCEKSKKYFAIEFMKTQSMHPVTLLNLTPDS